MYGLDPGDALGSTRVYQTLWRDPRNSWLLFFTQIYFPWVPGFPQRALSLDPSRARAHIHWLHFLSYLVSSKPNLSIISFWFQLPPIFPHMCHNQIIRKYGVSGYVNPGISFSPNAQLTRLRNQSLGPELYFYYFGYPRIAWGPSPKHGTTTSPCRGIGPRSSMRI